MTAATVVMAVVICLSPVAEGLAGLVKRYISAGG